MSTIAALYVERGGAYYGLPDVEPWDAERDARLYAGPWPVVAHPPCSRWCRLAGLVEARWGHKRGEDDGCFEAALAAVRTWGGVLEHPAYSDAWGAFGLNRPPSSGGWVVADFSGGWTCHVEQGRYGHAAKKATWLYAHGVDLPSLKWGSVPDGESTALVSWCGNHTSAFETRPRVGKAAAAATPDAFRDELVGMASTAKIELPSLRWGPAEGDFVPVSRARIGKHKTRATDALGGKGGRGASYTPAEFRNELIGIAKSMGLPV